MYRKTQLPNYQWVKQPNRLKIFKDQSSIILNKQQQRDLNDPENIGKNFNFINPNVGKISNKIISTFFQKLLYSYKATLVLEEWIDEKLHSEHFSCSNNYCSGHFKFYFNTGYKFRHTVFNFI